MLYSFIATDSAIDVRRSSNSKRCAFKMTSLVLVMESLYAVTVGFSVLARRYQRYTENCTADKNVIKYTSKPLQSECFLQCNLSPQSIETTDKTGLNYFSE